MDAAVERPARGRARVVVALLLLVAGGSFFLSSCSSGTASTPSTPPPGHGTPPGHTIAIRNFAFSPTDLSVAGGTEVVVHNEDMVTHNLTAADGSFRTGDIAPGGTGRFTAPGRAGAFLYSCTIHPYMRGTLVVTPASSSTSSSTS